MNCANHPDRQSTAFCQDCGKPLCQECTRTVGSAVYCEQSLAARLSGSGAPPPFSSGEPRGTYPPPPNGGSYTVTGNAGGVDYNVSGAIPPPPTPGAPNPGLAALLGLIPGVGAMYNGQYAKGIVHLVVFAILVSLSDEHGIFGLLTAGWICYQVIEAHHTARARRDGTPLPNPFGLNDLGERLGFGKSWPAPPPPNTNFTPAPSAPTPSGYTPPAPGYIPPQPNPAWNAPWENIAPPISPVPPYSAPGYPFDPNLLDTRNRFPTGALWLIGLGVFFLIGNVGIFHHLPLDRLLPFFLIGIGVWLFVRKMTETGVSLTDDGSPGYQYRLFFALQSSVWVVLVGVLFLLDSFGILSWGRSWPLFIILAGLMAIFRRVMHRSVALPTYPYPPPAASTPASGTSTIPSSQNDQEGK